MLQPITKIEGHVKLPGSKSLSNRILLLAALSKGTTIVKNILVRSQHLPVMRHTPNGVSFTATQSFTEVCVASCMLSAGQRGHPLHGRCPQDTGRAVGREVGPD